MDTSEDEPAELSAPPRGAGQSDQTDGGARAAGDVSSERATRGVLRGLLVITQGYASVVEVRGDEQQASEQREAREKPFVAALSFSRIRCTRASLCAVCVCVFVCVCVCVHVCVCMCVCTKVSRAFTCSR